MVPKPSSTSPTEVAAAGEAAAALTLSRSRYSETERAQLRHALETATSQVGAEPRGLAAAQLLVDMKLDVHTVEASLLCSLPAESEALSGDLSPTTLQLLEGVRRLDAIRWDRLDDEAAESLRRMFLAMARDVRVVLIVLALRVERMRGVSGLSPEAQRRVAQEVLDIFAPLANRLGIWQMKSELEDAAFAVLEPENFRRLSELLAQRSDERAGYIAEVINSLEHALEEAGIGAKVVGRSKHLYSIYKKMQRKQIDFEQIFDVSAVRVTTAELAQCYGALGIVHSIWRPLKGEFDDYIAMPKGNGYQSLHTAVVGPRGRPVEVQIRTREMHRFAEFGVAAHWAYKEQRHAPAEQDRFMVLRRLLDWERELEDPKQFVESLRTDIFEDQVLVFTPAGDVIDLPNGATPLDFAYRIHTMVGHRTRGARVNGQIVSLDQALRTGDRVEILTHKTPSPSRDWMNPHLGYLKTSSARSKVRHWFREQGRAEAIAAGRALMDKELQRLDSRLATPAAIALALEIDEVEDLYAALGYGDRSVQAVVSAALELERTDKKEPELAFAPAPPSARGASGVTLHGVSDVLGKRARCCNPLPGDQVLGFVTRGRGIVIHRRDCGNVRQSPEPERWVEIDWGPGEREAHSVEIEVLAQSSSGLLNRVVRLLTQFGVEVSAANTLPHREAGVRLRMTLQARDSAQLANAMQRVAAFGDVESVRVVSR